MPIRYALFFLLSMTVTLLSNAANFTLPSYQSRCGNVEILYPFGIGPNCSQNQKFFNIHCNTSFNPSKPYILLINTSASEELNYAEVVNISKSQIYVKNSKLQLASRCYDRVSDYNYRNYTLYLNFYLTIYTLSDTNQLIAFDCDDLAMVQQFSDSAQTFGDNGCLPYCPNTRNQSSIETCPGLGCFQTSLSKTDFVQVELVDMPNMRTNWRKVRYFRCSFAFVGMIGYNGNFTFNLSDLNDSTTFLKNNKEFIKSLLLDWRIDHFSNCTKTSCGKNSLCINWVPLYGGYHCSCEDGYEGNPYLSSWCQDIDECNENPCASLGISKNNLGSYNCYCRDGYYGDGKKMVMVVRKCRTYTYLVAK